MSAKVIASTGHSVKLPVATVNQTYVTLPTLTAGLPPPALIQVGDFVAYFPISSTTDKTFGVVSVASLAAGTSSSTNTATGPSAAYAAALALLFTTYEASPGAYLAGVSESQFRLGETYDLNSQLGQATVNIGDIVEADCDALLAAKEVGAYVTLDGVETAASTSGAYAVTLTPQKVSFFYDKLGSVQAGTACTATYAVGQLVERAPVGATKVKIKLISHLFGADRLHA